MTGCVSRKKIKTYNRGIFPPNNNWSWITNHYTIHGDVTTLFGTYIGRLRLFDLSRYRARRYRSLRIRER